MKKNEQNNQLVLYNVSTVRAVPESNEVELKG